MVKRKFSSEKVAVTRRIVPHGAAASTRAFHPGSLWAAPSHQGAGCHP